MIKIKRIYDSPSADDSIRILVDRLWPRGISKARADLDYWLKAIAPSPKLRKWFGHNPENWPIFREEYFKELEENIENTAIIEDIIGKNDKVTLLYAAKDPEHNHALVLKEFLEKKTSRF